MRQNIIILTISILVTLLGITICSCTSTQDADDPEVIVTPGEDGGFLKGKSVMEVRGKFVDIDEARGAVLVFPQNDYVFEATSKLNKTIRNKRFASSFRDNPKGVTEVRANYATKILIGLPYKSDNVEGWAFTGDIVNVLHKSQPAKNITYYIHAKEYRSDDGWISVPQPIEHIGMSTLVFGDSIRWADPDPLPHGTIITQSKDIKKVFIVNPTIAILPDGDYVAACSGAFRTASETGKVSVFISSDRGVTWTAIQENTLMHNYGNLFVHDGDLYLMGASGVRGDVTIRRSTDKGYTWTEPTSKKKGLLFEGEYHSAPVPVAYHEGRIWRGMEFNRTGNSRKQPLVVSAPANSDLLDADNWVASNYLNGQKDWITGGGRSFGQWIEGNVVVTPDNELVNILRVSEEALGGVAAIVRVTSPDFIGFDYTKDIIEFPGGGKKFTIRYDQQSNLYWSLTNMEFDEDRVKAQEGRYASGVACGQLRNRLVMCSSPDLRNWTVTRVLMSHDDPFTSGFQYVDWQFDGDDIIAVSRTAFQEERGLPIRQHDANYFLFHRFENFRLSE